MRLPRMARRVVAGATLASALLVPAAPGVADEVTTLADSGAGSLRSAIASTAPGGDVTFAPELAGGTILLSSELTIDKDLTIDGPGAHQLAVSGNGATRVVHVFGDGTEIEIEGLTIRDGRAEGDEALGAGVLITGGELVRLTGVAVLDNEVASTTRVPFGGGIAAVFGRVEVIDSTVAANRAAGGGGGGIFVGEPATFEVVNSTLAGNSATGGAGLLSLDATGVLLSSTIARNTAVNVAGGIGASPTASVTVERSLVTSNTAATNAACDAGVVSGGANVVDAPCSAASAPSDTVAAAAVGPLGDHGGPTDTILPLAGNPAIDHIGGPCPGVDQRGVARPQGTGCDAGAVEMRQGLAASGPLTLGSAPVGQNTAPASATITNTGELAAAIASVTLTGPNAGEVEAVADPDACALAMVLAAGETCTLNVRLSPTSVGAKQATYSVALPGSSIDVPVTGTGDPVPPPPASQGGGGAASTDPPPSPPAPSAEAVLVGARTKARKGGRLKLRVRCTTVGAARCAGSLTLRLGARKLKKAYSIAAGKDALVRIRLGAGDRRRLARRRSIRTAVTVITLQPDGSRRTTHRGSLKLLRA